MSCLPLELLHQICLSLHADGSDSRTTLSAFSRLNHACYELAAPLLYQHLSIKFCDIQSLQKAVSELTEDGWGRQFLKYARKLSVIGFNPEEEKAPPDRHWQLRATQYGSSRRIHDEPATRDSFLESHLTDPTRHDVDGFHVLNRPSSYKKWKRDWQPLAALIVRLSHLAQFEFFLRDNFPIALQDAISQHHPKCRLDLFYSQNVVGSLPGLASEVDPSLRLGMDEDWSIDVNLLRLEGLHTLPVQIRRKLNGQSGPLNVDEMLPFLFLAPNLKHLLLQKNVMIHPSLYPLLRQRWRSFAATMQPVPISSLQSITIGRQGAYEDILPVLANIVDLSQLRSLKLDDLWDAAMLTEVAAVVPNLERLFITMDARGWSYPDLNVDNPIGIAGICAFNPLKYLYLCGLRSASSLNAIIQRHGATLKGLIIEPSTTINTPSIVSNSGYKYPELDASGIRHLAESCPQLEELRLPIRRSMGDQKECEMYKAMGSFSALHSLALDLHFDPRPRSVNRREEIAPSVLREIFVNAAMDENLALQIWHLISSNQVSHRLQYLRILPFGFLNLLHDDHRVVDWFARSFLINRYNFQNVGVPTIIELGKKERVIINQARYEGLGERDIPERLAQVLSDLWPSEPVNGWESERCSFPLQPNGA
ncbi:hypothetical protein N7457_006161 [Penicillium paradoxum]|uniref:uncharacterized protein n=1 Tax=Penicillium paradoxum TaxID=176176 RepID=UPI0025478008|nr:uncharacterized protein N7457_006161 [Penicillium paradoxum]KAJ5781001.1 hypothetical protein N7457_006161 [Penicillium paradoxum]